MDGVGRRGLLGRGECRRHTTGWCDTNKTSTRTARAQRTAQHAACSTQHSTAQHSTAQHATQHATQPVVAQHTVAQHSPSAANIKAVRGPDYAHTIQHTAHTHIRSTAYSLMHHSPQGKVPQWPLEAAATPVSLAPEQRGSNSPASPPSLSLPSRRPSLSGPMRVGTAS